MPYRTVTGSGRSEASVRNSRFIAFAEPISSEEDAEALLTELRARHPDASHHCWAYRMGSAMRFSDDGEPGGTAGRPMLEVVLKRDLDRVALVVVRYFGGTRLGAGGLVRAYGGAAARALDEAGETLVEDRLRLEAHVPFAFVDPAHRLLTDTRGARLSSDEFDGEGWKFAVELPEAEAAEFRERLTGLTRGAATIADE